jgi:beta-lactamase class A
MKKLALVLVLVLLFPMTVGADDSISMPWDFEIFEEPCFRSEMAARLPSGGVRVVERGEDGWVKVERGFNAGWLNLRYSPAICALDGFFAPLGNNIAVFFKNLDTGFTYVHNPDRVLFAASLSKSNHAIYTYMLAERGLLDMYEVHTYTAADFWGGTGIMRFMPTGTQFTLRELLGLSIRESDNAAYRMLVRLTENFVFSYAAFVEEIGADPRMIQNVISQNTHARDAGLFMYTIFNYIESDAQFAQYLRYDMMNTNLTSHPYFTRWDGSMGIGCNGRGTRVNTEMIMASYPIARKYGWARNSFHDAAIVYAPSPYILVILSNMERGAHDLFAEISWFVENFNNRHFVSPTPLDSPLKGPDENAAAQTDTIFVFREGFIERPANFQSPKADFFSTITPKVFWRR